MLKFWKKKEHEPSPIDKEIDSVLESLKSYSPDTEDYKLALESFERLNKAKKEYYEEEEKSVLDGFKSVVKRIFETLTDPKVIGAVITSAVYVWWGKTCMRYDQDGYIPPNRMMGNGPKGPKQQF